MNIMAGYNTKNTITIWVLIFLILPFGTVQVQAQFSKKIHKIKEVQVVSRRDYYSEDQKTSSLDSLTLKNHRSNNLGELLSLATPIFIKSYGSRGSLAVPNLRGTTGNHTSVSWNGFPINSMTLGQCDLSLTPMEFVDKLSVIHSAPGTLYGSGTFGGAIALKNDVNWQKDHTLTLSSELGSWKNQRYSLQSALGNQRFRYRINGYFQKARNNFEFRDVQQFEQPIKERKNNGVQNFGIMQNVFYKISSRNKLEAGIWYQEREKEIPEIMGVSDAGNAHQRDSILRVYAQWKRVFDESTLQIRSGYFYHHQLYTEKENKGDAAYMIYSPIETKKWMNDLNYRYYLNNRMSVDLGGQYSRINANVNAYGKTIREYRGALIGAFKYTTRRLTSNFSIRKQFNIYTNPQPQVSAGINYRIIPEQLYIRSHYSTKYRLPTLNDKYWQPGGNKELQAEHGWSGEIGLGYTPYVPEPFQSLTGDITFYTSKIHDLIHWIPAEGKPYWHPVNTARVRTWGMESTASISLKWNRILFTLKPTYNYTRSINVNKENPDGYRKQLRYTPYHTLKNAFYSSWKNFSAGVNLNYTGSRYTTLDNSRALSPFSTQDFFLKKQFDFDSFGGELKFTVQNLFDEQYQIIANYPMPGRAYYINLKIHLNKLIN